MEHAQRIDKSFITKLPPELVLNVLLYLDVPGVLSIRKTCRQLNLVTQERPTWIHILHVYQAYLPIPRETYKAYHYEDTSLPSYSSEELERVVRYAKYTGDIWTKSRDPPFRLHSTAAITDEIGEVVETSGRRKGSTLLGMQLFLDRWLLVTYAEGLANLYDVGNPDEPPAVDLGDMLVDDNSTSARRKVLRAQLDREPWSSYHAAYDEVSSRVLLFVARSAHTSILEIYTIPLDSSSRLHHNSYFIYDLFQQIGFKTLSRQRFIRCVDPIKRVVILSSSNKIEVLRWSDVTAGDSAGNNMLWESVQRSNHLQTQTAPEDLEELWNGVLGARLLGHYVLVFRTRSLEIFHYHFPESGDQFDLENDMLHIHLKHAFSLTVRDVTFSDVAASWIPASNADSYEFKLLAHDVIQGLFQYVVTLLVPRPSVVPSNSEPNTGHPRVVEPTLEVKLLGVYPLSFGGAFKPSKRGSLISSISPSLAMQLSSSGTSTPTPIMSLSHSHLVFQGSSGAFGAGGNARGFISAHCIGPQGKRAVWVERKRTSTVREVQVWAMEPPSPVAICGPGDLFNKEAGDEKHELVVDDNLPEEFGNQVVYAAKSYDLRDDIVLCTFSELHGTIVLGHRSGEVSVLDLASS